MILYAKGSMPFGYFKKAGICLKLSAIWQCKINLEVCIPVCSQGRDTIASMGAVHKRKISTAISPCLLGHHSTD
jgi:hypothetical protein